MRTVRKRHEKTGSAARLRRAANIAAAAVILGLAVFITFVLVRPLSCPSRKQAATTDVAALRSAAQLYLSERADDCPSVRRLVEEGIIESHRRSTDPWDNPYVIRCVDGEVIVSSNGPDGLPDTADDVR